MRLDVIVPTYNRRQLLKVTLDSLLAAEVPRHLTVSVTVVDNNSSDPTRETVAAYQPNFGGRLHYVFEKKQGRSHALNAGIRSTRGDLVGMIDDDEQVDQHWFRRVYEMFSSGDVDFIGGPCKPHWVSSPPAWLPPSQVGVIGVVDAGSQHVYGTSEALLMGGNRCRLASRARKSRPVFDRLGPQREAPVGRRRYRDVSASAGGGSKRNL